MRKNKVYGSRFLGLKDIKYFFEESLRSSFNAKDSLYHGHYYQAGTSDSEHFLIKRNIDPLDGESVELDFPNYATLLYVNFMDRSAILNELLSAAPISLTLLREKDY